MTILDLHSRTVLPLQFRLCGADLLPLTIGHARILEAMELWAPRDPRELMLCALICSDSHRAFTRLLSSWRLPVMLRLWSWRLGRRWDWSESARVWGEYVDYNREEPVVSIIQKPQRSSTGRVSGTPWLSTLRVILCSECGYNPETIDDVAMSQATLDYYAWAELHGHVNVANLTTRQLREIEAVRN